MKSLKQLAILAMLLLGQFRLFSQDKLDIKFGKILPGDFDLSKAAVDSGTAAVVIADIGNCTFEGQRTGLGTWSIIFKRFKRIKIVNKNGFDAASEQIILQPDNDGMEEIKKMQASTFNLEDGKVVETKLDDKSIFTEKYGQSAKAVKFTLPAVKEGSIIDIEYTIISDSYYRLRPWTFQGEYPRLWSEYQVTIPSCFHYMALTQGDQQFAVETNSTKNNSYSIRVSNGTQSDDVYRINSEDLVKRWVKKNVPALKEEPYTSTLFNYLSRIEFQLHYFQWTPQTERHDAMGSWTMASEKLLKDEDFGGALSNDNNWANEDLRNLLNGVNDPAEKVKKIYYFVRDHFTCTDYDALYAFTPLKTVFKTRKGTVAELNLLLVSLLRHANINADPVILSTKENGFASETYPLMDRFNYVVCIVYNDNGNIYLDASRPDIAFSHLPLECYNGGLRTINVEQPYVVEFRSDSISETENTLVMIVNDDKGVSSGSLQTTEGEFGSYLIRTKIRKIGEKEYFKAIQTGFGEDLKIENTGIDSLKTPEFPVQVHYDFTLNGLQDHNVIYFNPMLSAGYKENPFKAAQRYYPVEMPFKMDEIYTLNMDIPKGYTVDELPKSARVAYNENEGLFEYLIEKNETSVILRCRLKLNRATFAPDEYNTLRDFFAYVVKKENEQIVFKKKS